jgi:hypothetical protein
MGVTADYSSDAGPDLAGSAVSGSDNRDELPRWTAKLVAGARSWHDTR